MWRMPLACAVLALAAAAQPATITGRVFDVYHRPVRAARVATVWRTMTGGKPRIVAGIRTTVDEAGMFRLSVPPGRYLLAVLPPPGEMDHAAIFPVYFQDTTDFSKAQPIDVSAGEIRPFTDFLVLEVESHRLSGRLTGISKVAGIPVALRYRSGYTDPIRVTTTDRQGQFRFEHVPAGSYEVTASSQSGQTGSTDVDLTPSDVAGVQVHLRPGRGKIE